MISDLSKSFNASLITMGIQGMQREYSKAPCIVKPANLLSVQLQSAGVNCSFSYMDYEYFLTDWRASNDCLKYIQNILTNFPWTKEKHDCDNRASLIASLFNIFTLTTGCGTAYGKVYDLSGKLVDWHYWNIIATSDGKVYGFDIDAGGSAEILKGKPQIFGQWRHELTSVRFL
jgi:hypothetical protein